LRRLSGGRANEIISVSAILVESLLKVYYEYGASANLKTLKAAREREREKLGERVQLTSYYASFGHGSYQVPEQC
jgi:hypothetical protein